MFKKASGVVFFFFIVLAASLQAQFNVLHSFTGGTADGQSPQGSLVIGGPTIYGTAQKGGANGYGVVYRINKDGTGFALLHSFANDATDGYDPYGTLILKGKTLYGMTSAGGTSNMGTIFKINTNGTGYAVLHHFAGGAADGRSPCQQLAAKGLNLYGMTCYGGSSDCGTVFTIKTTGTGFAVLHSFAGGTADGRWPFGALAFKGMVMYGMTISGGANVTGGTIFKIGTKGTGYAVLYHFVGDSEDGYAPYGSVLIKGKALYGMASLGGNNDRGVIFKSNLDGSGFTVLHHFSAETTDGCYPFGSLTVKGNVLFGMTAYGGTATGGAIFAFDLKAWSFAVLHSFTGGIASDGWRPYDSLIIKNGILYGMTARGGTADKGTIFSYSTK